MKILVIRNQIPWPLHHGGRLHCFELCRRLAQRHELTLIAQKRDSTDEVTLPFHCVMAGDDRLLDDPTDLNGDKFIADRWEQYFGISMAFTRDIVRLARQWHPDIVIGMNFQSLAYLAKLPEFPTVYDPLDDEVLFQILETLHGRTKSRWSDLKGLFATLAFVRGRIRRVDAVSVVSHRDEQFCRLYSRHPHIETIENGVDSEYYAPVHEPTDEQRIVFWGNLDFAPNISAIEFFADRVWPKVRQQRPGLRWVILGGGSSPRLERIRSTPGIEWMGFVEDIRPHVAKSSVVVIPMQTGAGIKNKLMEAWAMGKPVLCTPRALGDLPGVHGENVWLAKSPSQLSDGLLRLLEDQELRARLGMVGRKTAVEHCSWDRAARRLENLCHQVIIRRQNANRSALAQSDSTAPGLGNLLVK